MATTSAIQLLQLKLAWHGSQNSSTATTSSIVNITKNKRLKVSHVSYALSKSQAKVSLVTVMKSATLKVT